MAEVIGIGNDLDLGTDELLDFGLDVLRIDPGHDAAIHGRLRHLRKRVVGMAALQHRRDAARAGQADLERVGLDLVGRSAIVWVCEPAADCLAERGVAFLLRALLEIAAAGVVEHWREAMALKRLQRIGQLVDRIVRPRPRAVTARIMGREEIGLEGLFGGRDSASDRPEVLS